MPRSLMPAALRLLRLLPLLLLAPAAGCADDECPHAEKLDDSAEAPGLIRVLFSVECLGEPVTTLSESDLVLREDGETVSRSESDWVLQDVTAQLDAFTLLLIDVSASILADGTLETARQVATDFADSLIDQEQQVAVAIFDGDPEIRVLQEFTRDKEAVAETIGAIDEGDQRDPSTNLNGAVIQGLEILDGVVVPDVEAELVSVANLVIFTDGVDRAQRETDAAAQRAVAASEHDVFLVALTGEPEEADELAELAPDGFFQAESAGELIAAFDALTESLVAETNKYYLLSYCSPLRAGRRTLEIEVVLEDGTDTISTTYVADEFGPGCALPAD